MIVVVSSCEHHRRVARGVPGPCCVTAAPAVDPECPWCVWLNPGTGFDPGFSVVPGSWTRCNACDGTGVLRPKRNRPP